MSIKILHVENSKKVTGSMTALLKMIEHRQNQFESIIALPKSSQNGILAEQLKIRYCFFDFIELRKKISAVLKFFPKLFLNALAVYRYCKKEGIQVIHSNDHYNMVPVVMKFFWGSKVKLITHVRLMPSTYNHQLYGVFRALNKKYADRIVVVSNAVLKAYGSGDKIAQIYDSYPIHEKYPAFIVSPDKPLRFLYLSNYIQGKGHDLAIKAFAVFNKTNRKGELHLHGSTMNLAKNESYKTYLQKLGDELGLSGKIFFNGFSQDVEKIYKAHDVSLMFSESESFSMICYESMTFGVPVIASDCGGPAEIVEHKKNGLLVTNKDVNDMAQAMQYLYDNYEERKKFSEKGREKINEMIHSNGDFFSLVEELLNESKK